MDRIYFYKLLKNLVHIFIVSQERSLGFDDGFWRADAASLFCRCRFKGRMSIMRTLSIEYTHNNKIIKGTWPKF